MSDGQNLSLIICPMTVGSCPTPLFMRRHLATSRPPQPQTTGTGLTLSPSRVPHPMTSLSGFTTGKPR
uniref:Uncharacterized protein n=1 Tax=uncultured marine virus TaxID=186617 RepID=A0A0F7L5U1_9VIRU|nr:hypothetical protein [uncultured marine virus]